MMIKGFVKKEDVFKVIAENNYIDRMTLDCYDRLIDGVNKLSTVKERAKGKWIDKNHNGLYNTFKCSICKKVTVFSFERFNYCPNCGADMRDIDNLKEVGKDAGEKASQDVLMPLA